MVGLPHPHFQRHRRLVGAALAPKSTGSPSLTRERVNERYRDFATVTACGLLDAWQLGESVEVTDGPKDR
jgi:hypothetical protein